MKPVHRQSLAIAAAVVRLASIAAAQEKPTTVLNTLEVRQLVARAEPADNARLSARFSVLADQYAGETKRHTAMSQSFVGKASRNLGTGMSVHCKRLADLNTQEASTLRELATYHANLAGGKAAAPPAGAARYQSGAGAKRPTDKELAELAAKARTPADHHSLEVPYIRRTLRRRGEGARLVRGWAERHSDRTRRSHPQPARDAVPRRGEGGDCGCRHAQAARHHRAVTQ